MPCFVSERCTSNDKTFIRSKVCLQGQFGDSKWTDGRHYCLLHLPNPNKNVDTRFDRLISDRIAEGLLNFQGVFFPERFICTTALHNPIESELDFKFATFNGEALFFNEFKENLNLAYCDFRAGAQFSSAIIRKYVLFHYSSLNGYFSFGDVDLSDGSGISFNLATSTAASKIRFGLLRNLGGKISFDSASIGGSLHFDGTFDERSRANSQLFSIKDAVIEHPERVRFHDCLLDANWFLNVDSRKFSFANIEWKPIDKVDSSPHSENIYRNLASNAEESEDYRHASFFRYRAMESARLRKHWKKVFNLYWWYKWSSGYGENWDWAAIVLVGLLFLFGLLYNSPFATFERPKEPNTAVVSSYDPSYKMNNGEGMIYSLNVAALQHPEPKPADNQTKLFIIVETILAPLQAALLALAIRRKFMR